METIAYAGLDEAQVQASSPFWFSSLYTLPYSSGTLSYLGNSESHLTLDVYILNERPLWSMVKFVN